MSTSAALRPALSAGAAALVSRLFDLAREHGARVSFDVNFRPGLWDAGTAAPVLRSPARRADVVFAGQDDAMTLWNTPTPEEVRAGRGTANLSWSRTPRSARPS